MGHESAPELLPGREQLAVERAGFDRLICAIHRALHATLGGVRMPHIVRRLWNLVRPRQLDADLVDEIEFHRFMKQQELEARGMEPGKARFQAQRALGNVRLAREDARAASAQIPRCSR
jgi:hypothetical protein